MIDKRGTVWVDKLRAFDMKYPRLAEFRASVRREILLKRNTQPKWRMKS